MYIDLKKLFEDKSFVSPGSLGGKIKRFRELRGWTQKELGLKAGYTASTADVRVVQYEKNKKIPREKALTDLADALEVDREALFDADMLSLNCMYHALFEIEEFHGLHPVKIGSDYYLEFSEYDQYGSHAASKREYFEFMKNWYEKRQKCLSLDTDSEEEKERKQKEYALWRAQYPHNIAKETSERIRDQRRMDQLQAEMDALNAKMKSEEEIARLDKALEDIIPQVLSSYDPIERESDFIFIIKDMLENGVGIERFSPEERVYPDLEETHLLSIKTEEIVSDEDKTKLYAKLVCALESMQQYGIEIHRKITSRNGELYVTYTYPASQYMYFQILQAHWDDMFSIRDKKGMWPEWQVEELEKKFQADVLGERDVSFAE